MMSADQPTTLHSAFICIGSNWGNRVKTVRQAISHLVRTTDSLWSSTIYETPAAGKDSGTPAYMNAVVKIRVNSDYPELNLMLKRMELEAGRNEECRNLGRVPLDLDIVEFDGEVLRPEDFRQKYYRIGRNGVAQQKD